MDSTILEKSEDKNTGKTNQIFKNSIPLHFLWEFLKANFTETDNHFQLSSYLYHKAEYNQRMFAFISSLKPYYYTNKRKYIERQMNYKGFLTIIRQICNAHHIKYTTKLVYNKSMYEIEYSIYKLV